MRNLTAVLALLATFAAQAAEECSGEDHVSQRECLEKIATQTEAALRQADAVLHKRIDTWDDEDRPKKKSLALLDAANLAFQRFKKTQCEFEASSAAGGNGAGDLRLMCVIRMNREYTKQLEDKTQWFSP